MAVEAQRPPAERAPARPRPRREREEEVLVWPDLLFPEFISAVLFTTTFLILSVFINAPLLNRANPEVTPNPSKAPWYFLNLQELLLHMDAGLAGVTLPTIALLFFVVIPYLDRSREAQGVWFGSKFAVRLTVVAAIYAAIVTWGLVAIDDGETTRTERLTSWIPRCEAEEHAPRTPCLFTAEGTPHRGFATVRDLETRFRFSVPFPNVLGIDDNRLAWPRNFESIEIPTPDLPLVSGSFDDVLTDNVASLIVEVLIPIFLITFFALLIIYVLFRVGWLRTRRDVFIVMFTSVMVAFFMLSIVGAFFRGPAQALVPPWDIAVDPG